MDFFKKIILSLLINCSVLGQSRAMNIFDGMPDDLVFTVFKNLVPDISGLNMTDQKLRECLTKIRTMGMKEMLQELSVLEPVVTSAFSFINFRRICRRFKEIQRYPRYQIFISQFRNIKIYFDAIIDNLKRIPRLLTSGDGFADALSYIVSNGTYVNLIPTLVLFGTSVNDRLHVKYPLEIAIEKGYLHVVQALIRQGANVNAVNSDRISLIYLSGKLDVTQALVDAGVNVNVRRNLRLGNYLIHDAVLDRNLGLVKVLLTSRNIQLNFKNRAGETPLFLAEKKGYGEIVEVLRAAQRRA